MKIMYVAGPGNVIETFKYWKENVEDPSQVSMTFSGQFYDVCSVLGAQGYIIASNPDKKFLKENFFTLEHRPILLSRRSGLLYYFGQILYELSLVISAIQFRANVVVGSATSCFFVLSVLPKFGISVIPSLHCVLWPKYILPSKAQSLLWKVNRSFFAKDCLAILSTSEDINDQIKQITKYQPRPIINFLSTYRRDEFEDITPPTKDRSIFHILFAGRIEANKGVFDLVEIAKYCKSKNGNNIIFHICGTGSALGALSKQVKESALESSFILHGYCNKQTMHEMLSLSHVVIVPTKSDFTEGLNQVVIESILAGRPVITSSVCPALFYVQDAAVEVPPDDVQAYANAILKLYSNYDFYQEKQQNCQQLQEQFYSLSHSWGNALKSILSELLKQPKLSGGVDPLSYKQ